MYDGPATVVFTVNEWRYIYQQLLHDNTPEGIKIREQIKRYLEWPTK